MVHCEWIGRCEMPSCMAIWVIVFIGEHVEHTYINICLHCRIGAQVLLK